MDDDRFFEDLASATDGAGEGARASARLKARLYSALVAEQARTGPLLGLRETKARGHALCVFEALVAGVPAGVPLLPANPCRVCHARVLGERFDSPPTYWPHCPYVDLRRGTG